MGTSSDRSHLWTGHTNGLRQDAPTASLRLPPASSPLSLPFPRARRALLFLSLALSLFVSARTCALSLSWPISLSGLALAICACPTGIFGFEFLDARFERRYARVVGRNRHLQLSGAWAHINVAGNDVACVTCGNVYTTATRLAQQGATEALALSCAGRHLATSYRSCPGITDRSCREIPPLGMQARLFGFGFVRQAHGVRIRP